MGEGVAVGVKVGAAVAGSVNWSAFSLVDKMVGVRVGTAVVLSAVSAKDVVAMVVGTAVSSTGVTTIGSRSGVQAANPKTSKSSRYLFVIIPISLWLHKISDKAGIWLLTASWSYKFANEQPLAVQ
jgi:hypothetical protein